MRNRNSFNELKIVIFKTIAKKYKMEQIGMLTSSLALYAIYN